MHDSQSKDDAAIAEAAAEWIARRDRLLSRAEIEELDRWENADPRHRAELRRLGGAWNDLNSVRAVPGLRIMADDILARARGRRMRHRGIKIFGAVCSVAAAVALGFAGWQRMAAPGGSPASLGSANVRVLDSTMRRMVLPDGSIAELNGSSRIEVHYSATERRVRLAEGEAHFVVAKNPERPFLVTAGPVTVRAVGTAFNVRIATAAVEVLVTQGEVQLERAGTDGSMVSASRPGVTGAPAESPPAALVAGQRATIDRAPADAAPEVAINDVGPAEIEDALGWQSTRLIFNNTSLAEVVAGFNRYNRHQLTLGDPKLGERALTGVFRADNLEGFIRLLRASVDVRTEQRTPAETVLLPMR